MFLKGIIYYFEFVIFFRLFSVSDLVNKQAVLCHRVLRTVQTAAENSRIMNRDTWECLLKFLLGINNTLLAPPIHKGTAIIVLLLSNLLIYFCLLCE